MSVRIIVDSTSDLTSAAKERVIVIPLTVHFGSEEYMDGITIDHKTFYEKLVNDKALPSTSQATPAAFEDQFRRIQDTGDSAVVITLSAKLSGTYQSAVIAAENYESIHVMESGSVAIGSGILVEWALQLADEGMDAAAIVNRLEEEKHKLRVVAVVDTLEYLKRGGRVSKTVAFAGNLLNIKPILGIIDGEIQMLSKARGAKQAFSLLNSEIEKAGGVDFSRPAMLGYTGLSEDQLLAYRQSSQDFWDQASSISSTIIGSVIGTHAGPGAVAVAFFAK